ncbi:MAG: GNAT family N-acetyltransferase [Candidatus Hydrogenedentes bacterium]|nr:GNAT family N-acetyltransferase [Candidatus Hydrogenedentota bacterium]
MTLREITIRRATFDDYDAACALYRTVDNYHLELYPSIFQEVDGPARPRERFEAKLSDPLKAVFVAAHRGELCGLADVTEEEAPPYPMFKPARIARIDNLVVAEAYRRRGIARALLEAVRGWASEHALGRIQLSVYSKNTDALAFYEDAGFSPLVMKLELDH